MLIPTALNILIRELGEKMQLNNLFLDPEGACAVNLDKQFVINFQYRETQDQLWLYADLGVPAGGQAIYCDLLRGNLFWDATKGATISLSGDEPSHVVMAISLTWRNLNDITIAQRLETFVNTIEDWTEYISSKAENRLETTNQPHAQGV
jgi:hypothetical protein